MTNAELKGFLRSVESVHGGAIAEACRKIATADPSLPANIVLARATTQEKDDPSLSQLVGSSFKLEYHKQWKGPRR